MPVTMVPCPTCGSVNSAKRETCFSCQQPLKGAPTGPQPVNANPRACRNCISASVFAPAGQQMGPRDIWCNKEGVPKSADSTGGKCFQQGFTWSKFEALD